MYMDRKLLVMQFIIELEAAHTGKGARDVGLWMVRICQGRPKTSPSTYLLSVKQLMTSLQKIASLSDFLKAISAYAP